MSRMGETYWAKRAAARMAEEELSAEKRLSALAVPYRRAQGAILAQIKGIQSAYMRRYGVDEEDMRSFLSRPADKKTLERLARMIAGMPDGREKRRLQAQLNAPATRYRISNLQAMREQVKAAAETLSGEEQRLFTDSLTRTIRESYLRDSYDLQKRAGVLLEPNGVSTRFVRQALREDWSGKNYKTRIEGRYEDLARRVQESILQNLMGGGSQARMAEDIAREFRTSYHAAKRLMTTETCYVMNAAHVEGFEEYAVPEYRIIAVLDLRTSDICQEQDGKIYKRDEAVAGETMPPFHPNCRSTVSPVTDRKWLDTMTRRATDPVTGETETLPPGTTYPQWLKMIEERYGKEKIDQLRGEQKAKVTAKNEAVQAKIDRADGKTRSNNLQDASPNDIIGAGKRQNDWSKAEFTTDKPLQYHWGKHRDEFEAGITPEEYLKRARDLLGAQLEPGKVEEVKRGDGSISRYDYTKNEFVATANDGHIRTFMRPIEKEAYWEYEHTRNK